MEDLKETIESKEPATKETKQPEKPKEVKAVKEVAAKEIVEEPKADETLTESRG